MKKEPHWASFVVILTLQACASPSPITEINESSPLSIPMATIEPALDSPLVSPPLQPTTQPSPRESQKFEIPLSPTSAPTMTPSPTPRTTFMPPPDLAFVEKTTFNGKIYDDTGAPLDGVTVEVRSLSKSIPYYQTTTTISGGSFAFNNAPSGVSVEIITSKPGYTTRRRIEVLKSNKQGDPNSNKYDFGNVETAEGTSFLPPVPASLENPILSPTPLDPFLLSRTAELATAPIQQQDFLFFSYDDSASTAVVQLTKNAIQTGTRPNKAWARPWEFLSAETFTLDTPLQTIGRFKASMGLWQHDAFAQNNRTNYELGVQVEGPTLTRLERKPAVITWVVDTSASMKFSQGIPEANGSVPNLLELAQTGLQLLPGSLRIGDVLNLVTFSDQATVVLENDIYNPADDAPWQNAVKLIFANGDSDLAAGLEKGFLLAQQYFDSSKTNRVILLSDALQTDDTPSAALKQMVQKYAAENILFSAIGMGQQANEPLLNELTDAGQGAYYQVSTPDDARRSFQERLMGLLTVAANKVRFRLDFPLALTHESTAAKESSSTRSEVRATSFSYNTHPYFWEAFSADKNVDLTEKTLKLTLFYTDPDTGVEKIETLEKPIGQLLGKNLDSIKDAHTITLLTGLINDTISLTRVQQEITSLLNAHQTPLAMEYKGYLNAWPGLKMP